MFLPELGKLIHGERYLTSNNRIIRISAGSNNRKSTVSMAKPLHTPFAAQEIYVFLLPEKRNITTLDFIIRTLRIVLLRRAILIFSMCHMCSL